MKAVVLAAGYATRLYPLTLDKPKPLLEVGGRPILERLLEQLAEIEELDTVYVVTNSKFARHFEAFARDLDRMTFALRVVDDGTTSDETKLGAIGDLDLVIRQEGIDDDLIVAAGDSIFGETRLADFARFCAEKNAAAEAVYDVGDPGEVKKYSAVTIDGDGRMLEMVEKPEDPQTTLVGIALYFYPRHVLPLVRQYVAEGNNADQPGRLVQWLHTREPVYTWRVPGRWYDIGSQETLAAADREFSQS
jgi:glucose-1-phosphate thymidylyltransferase